MAEVLNKLDREFVNERENKLSFIFKFENGYEQEFFFNQDIAHKLIDKIKIVEKKYTLNNQVFFDYLSYIFTEVKCCLNLEGIEVDRAQIGAIYNNAVPTKLDEVLIKNFLHLTTTFYDEQYKGSIDNILTIKTLWNIRKVITNKMPDISQNVKEYRDTNIDSIGKVKTIDHTLIPEALNQFFLMLNGRKHTCNNLIASSFIEAVMLWIAPYKEFPLFISRQLTAINLRKSIDIRYLSLLTTYNDLFKLKIIDVCNEVFKGKVYDLTPFVQLFLERYEYIIKWTFINSAISSDNTLGLTLQQMRILIYAKLHKNVELAKEDFNDFLNSSEFCMEDERFLFNINKLVKLDLIKVQDNDKWVLNNDNDFIKNKINIID